MRNYNYNFIINGESGYQEYEMNSKNDGPHVYYRNISLLDYKISFLQTGWKIRRTVSQKSRFLFFLERQDWLIERSAGRSCRAWTNRGKPAGFGRRRSKNCPMPTGLYILSFGVQQSVLNLSPPFFFPTHPKPISTLLWSFHFRLFPPVWNSMPLDVVPCHWTVVPLLRLPFRSPSQPNKLWLIIQDSVQMPPPPWSGPDSLA